MKAINISTQLEPPPSKFKKYFQDYCDSSGIQGFRYIGEDRSIFEKLFWILILVISITGCGFMISAIWDKYIQNPFVISFSNKDERIYNVPFPTITICPYARFNYGKFNYTEYMYKLAHKINLTLEEQELFGYSNVLCGGEWKASENAYKFMLDMKPDFLKLSKCEFMGTEYDCEDIFMPIIEDKGVCYSFNGLDRTEQYTQNIYIPMIFSEEKRRLTNFNPNFGYKEGISDVYPKRAVTPGTENSLYIIMGHNLSDWNDICGGVHPQGFNVILHNSWEKPFRNQHEISLNTEVKMAITPELLMTSDKVAGYSSEKRKCSLPNERKLNFFKYYSQPNCLNECIAKFLLERCGCAMFYMPRNNQTAMCASDKCTVEAVNGLSHLFDYSSCDCKPMCKTVKYSVEKSVNKLDLDEYYSFLNSVGIEIGDGQHEGVEFSALRIYFKEDYFTPLQRTELYGFTDLVSNFGGLLGLFTGFSLMSLVELIYYLTLRIYCNERMYGRWEGI